MISYLYWNLKKKYTHTYIHIRVIHCFSSLFIYLYICLLTYIILQYIYIYISFFRLKWLPWPHWFWTYEFRWSSKPLRLVQGGGWCRMHTNQHPVDEEKLFKTTQFVVKTTISQVLPLKTPQIRSTKIFSPVVIDSMALFRIDGLSGSGGPNQPASVLHREIAKSSSTSSW